MRLGMPADFGRWARIGMDSALWPPGGPSSADTWILALEHSFHTSDLQDADTTNLLFLTTAAVRQELKAWLGARLCSKCLAFRKDNMNCLLLLFTHLVFTTPLS